MSLHHFQKQQQQDDQQQEDDDEEEVDAESFQDSLDRILSSASASASASSAAVSEDDYDNQNSPNYNSDNPGIPIPKFPISGTKFDVWINGPLSVQERRKRLLKEMGLSKDPLLSRKDMEIGRSASYDHLLRKGELPPSPSTNSSDCFITRSKSDSSAATTSDYCNHSIISTTSVCKDVSFVDKTHVCSDSRRNENENERNSGSPSVSNNKPPSGRNSKRKENTIRLPTKLSTDTASESPESFTFDVTGREHVIDSVCNGVVKNPHILKNVENDKGFIVKEIDTGHQYTREEFESCAGHSPIVQELMRRQNVERLDLKKNEFEENEKGDSVGRDNGSKLKKKGSWFKSIKNVANVVTGHWEKRNSDEWDASSGRRSSSGTDDSQNMSHHYPEKVRVRQYGKSCKDLTGLYKNQEIQAHNGSIWSIKFSSDGQYLASAGEDCVIHVWQVTESKMRGDVFSSGHTNPFFVPNDSPGPTLVPTMGNNHLEKKRRSKVSGSRKSVNLDHIIVPDSIFMLSETPICSFSGHLDDVLDLSWSNSQYLLSSSMDKTVKLWHRDSISCLKTFSHSDYVTCIQFNPVDDRYFISGSLDAKVRIWSIPERQVVDWYDLHEMVTAASYTPDGQGALVGSYNGSCRLFNTSENKLQQKSQIDLQNKRKKSHLKKITGFQFAPGNSSEVLITSADSRIRVVDGSDLVHKFKGFRNTNSQMSASLTRNGKYVVCASEDSYVYVWKHEGNSRRSRNKGVTITNSHEHFLCRDVSVAIPWPILYAKMGIQYNSGGNNCLSAVNGLSGPTGSNQCQRSPSQSPRRGTNSTLSETVSNMNNSYFFDRFSVTWPEEKLPLAGQNQIPRNSFDLPHRMTQDSSALGMVIVTASLKGQISIFQNFGLPVRV